MAEYLEKYIERVAELPAVLHQKFRIIRDLDLRSAQLQSEINEKCKEQLESLQARGTKPGHPPSKRARMSTDETPLSAEIVAGQKKLVSWAEEKMHIAAQVYDMIDKHIRELDEDLKALNSDLESEQQSAGLQHGEASERLGIDLGPAAAAAAAAAQGAAAAHAAAAAPAERQKRKYTRRKGVAAAELVTDGAGSSAAAEAAAAAVATAAAAAAASAGIPEGDASEPRYCICKGVSYGDMICCDNDECPIEWFHFGCVGIKEQPKGKWYCPQCTTEMALKQGAS